MGHCDAYKDEGTPEEQSRRTFMVNAVVALGAVTGIGIAIPVVTSLMPAAGSLAANWTPLSPDEFKKLEAATATPVKVNIAPSGTDGYFPEATAKEFVWAIRIDEATMRAKRPDLFAGSGKLAYPVVNMGFTVFSPICPHLGCPYEWKPEKTRFVCPCHGSEYSNVGEHLEGPAQRGLDPLPLRAYSGAAEITWIHYNGNAPSRIVLSYRPA
jgi:Rieske Fe-S protein